MIGVVGWKMGRLMVFEVGGVSESVKFGSVPGSVKV